MIKFPREMKGTMKARVAVQNRDNNPMINRRRWYRSQETFSRFWIMLLRREPGLEQCVLKQKFECKGELLGKELSCDDWHEKHEILGGKGSILITGLMSYTLLIQLLSRQLWLELRNVQKKFRLRYSSWFKLIIALVIRHNIYFFY